MQYILIGSGVSSIGLGIYLLQRGDQVEILERRPEALGGYLETIKIGQSSFSWGPRYLWDFEPGRIGHQVFGELGLSSLLPFDSLNLDHFNRIFVGTQAEIAVPVSWSRYEEILLDRFRSDGRAIKTFFSLASAIYPVARTVIDSNFHFQPPVPRFTGMLRCAEIGLIGTAKLLYYGRQTLQQVFDACGCSQPLQAVLSAHLAIMAETPRDVSFVGYVGGTMNYHQGSQYPACHIEGVLSGLVSRYLELGGRFRKGASTTRFLTDGGRIRAVLLQGGETISADRFVSNIDPRTTVRWMPDRERFALPGYENGMSMVSYFVSMLPSMAVRAKLDSSNVWILKDATVLRGKSYDNFSWADTMDYLYLNSPTLFPRPDHQDFSTPLSITGFSPMGYRACRELFDHDQQLYEDEKRKLGERFVRSLSDFLGEDISSCIGGVLVRTPLEKEELLGAVRGATYGTRFTNQDLFWRRIPMTTPVENLYFCSAYTSLPGVSSCLKGARYLAGLLNGR
jgi:phytoene dehydrogenase-like protein